MSQWKCEMCKHPEGTSREEVHTWTLPQKPRGPTPELYQLTPSLFQTGWSGGTSTAAPESDPTQVRRQQWGARFTCLHLLHLTQSRGHGSLRPRLGCLPRGWGGAGWAQKSYTKHQQQSSASPSTDYILRLRAFYSWMQGDPICKSVSHDGQCLLTKGRKPENHLRAIDTFSNS